MVLALLGGGEGALKIICYRDCDKFFSSPRTSFSRVEAVTTQGPWSQQGAGCCPVLLSSQHAWVEQWTVPWKLSDHVTFLAAPVLVTRFPCRLDSFLPAHRSLGCKAVVLNVCLSPKRKDSYTRLASRCPQVTGTGSQNRWFTHQCLYYQRQTAEGSMGAPFWDTVP